MVGNKMRFIAHFVKKEKYIYKCFKLNPNPTQNPFTTRHEKYEYCCALGMVPSVENDDVQRAAIFTALGQKSNGLLDLRIALKLQFNSFSLNC